jgi:hypothetical protein
MPHNRKYKIIAVFLLTVFSLNTLAGFACSVGVDMGYNSRHHHDEEMTEATVHVHEKENNHKHSKSHKHDGGNNHDKSKEDKDNCCNDKVAMLGQVDKTIPQSLNIIHPIFLIAFFDSYYSVLPSYSDIVKDIKQFVRSYHPPISNIRIAIQSFQI